MKRFTLALCLIASASLFICSTATAVDSRDDKGSRGNNQSEKVKGCEPLLQIGEGLYLTEDGIVLEDLGDLEDVIAEVISTEDPDNFTMAGGGQGAGACEYVAPAGGGDGGTDGGAGANPNPNSGAVSPALGRCESHAEIPCQTLCITNVQMSPEGNIHVECKCKKKKKIPGMKKIKDFAGKIKDFSKR